MKNKNERELTLVTTIPRPQRQQPLPLRLLPLTLLLLILVAAGSAQPAWATILWVGGEPLDFPVGPGSVGFTTSGTTAASFRSTYTRGSVYVKDSGSAAYSNPISGTVASSSSTVWLSARVYVPGSNACNGSTWGSNYKIVGLVNSANKNGLWFGYTGCSGSFKAGIYKDGSSIVDAASATLYNSTLHKIDLQITNYSATTGVVNLYLDNGTSPVATLSGTGIASSSTTTLDSVGIGALGTYAGCLDSCLPRVSEIIVSDTDTRNLSLATLPTSANGDTTEWTGNCTTLSKSSGIDDSTTVLSSTSGQRQQCTMGALPTGSFQVLAFGLSARVVKSISGIGYFSLGVKSNSTLYEPTAVAIPGAFSLVQTLMNTNPTTSAAWTTTELGSVQFNLKSSDTAQ